MKKHPFTPNEIKKFSKASWGMKFIVKVVYTGKKPEYWESRTAKARLDKLNYLTNPHYRGKEGSYKVFFACFGDTEWFLFTSVNK